MAATAVGLTAVELAGDSALKVASKSYDSTAALLAVVGMGTYALLGWIILRSDRSGAQWGIVNSYWNALNNIITPLAMMFLFGESYTHTQWLGIVVIAAGILLLDGA